jgi:photosystem II stability/assembly factor-like uncharacterized protein
MRTCLCLLLLVSSIDAQEKPAADALGRSAYSALKLRSIGPALTSGRISSIAVHPTERATWYVSAASGGVWKTINAGTTWEPIFDGEGSYSIGCVVLDPKNPHVVWVGSGENNSQRSVGYGDGVYRSDDGGKSWRNMGLRSSEHITRILIDPRDSNTIYVAAQGPLWAPGGDRGLYKSVDGGKTWKKVLDISENTGVTDVVMDPRNPDILIAAAYQRRRHVWTLINGGPESALYKSIDAGKTWKKLTSGLPGAEMGRIGLAMASSDPDIVYAIIEAAEGQGVYRSSDSGETWEKRNPFNAQGQYYSTLFVDPKDKNRIYIMGVVIRVSDDGGRTLREQPQRYKHVDNHVIWIEPKDNSHYLVGCDGGIYESFDRGRHWKFVANLPITQFYDVTCDESGPFYHVYGGTQDNFTLGGPARTRSIHGITNDDWFVVQGGDGFHCKVDPKDPNIVYAEAQYGILVRFDRKTGQRVGIQPEPGKGEPPLRWNWDSPLLISPHSSTRLYFAANKVFKSDDRGNSWQAVSKDLTRQIDRDKLPVMGKVWGADAVAKHISTSFYGNITALAESPKQEGLLYAGTDDGLIQITDDGGKNWRKTEKFPGVPERAYVARIVASQHEAKVVYAAFDNHKTGDFAPHLLRSDDMGKTWMSIRGDLPERGSVKAFAEDHKEPGLLFAGTEFALYFTIDGGKKWHRLRNGLPTISVKDLAIQRQQNDLVVGTFGRGIYILDDYSALRQLKPETLAKEAVLFPVREAQQYILTRKYGESGKAFLGDSFFTSDNPSYGATFSYHLKETIKTKKQKRLDAEKKDPKYQPSKDDLRAEAEEEAPAVLLSIHDENGKLVRTLTGPVTAGMHRVTWDLRYPPASLTRGPASDEEDEDGGSPSGPPVMVGAYRVSLAKRVDGVVTALDQEQTFKVSEENGKLDERKTLSEFQQKVLKLERTAMATVNVANETATKLAAIKKAADQAPALAAKWKDLARDLEKKNRDILRALRGDVVLRGRNENTPVSVLDRIRYIAGSSRMSLGPPTKTQQESYRIANEELSSELAKLRKLIDGDLKELEKALEEAGAPVTPGRLPMRGD